MLVDVGTADTFLEKELKPELLERACADAGIKLTLNMREATTTAIISSRPSWPIICAGTRSGWPRHCKSLGLTLDKVTLSAPRATN